MAPRLPCDRQAGVLGFHHMSRDRRRTNDTGTTTQVLGWYDVLVMAAAPGNMAVGVPPSHVWGADCL